MGRMLDALKQPHRTRSAEEPPRPEPVAAADNDLREDRADIPFIEVGGPRTPQPPPKAPEPPPRPPEAPRLILRTDLARTPEAAPWPVQYRPWTPTETAPTPQIAPEVIAFHQPEHAVSVQYRAMLGGLLKPLAAGTGQVLLFTAPAPWTGTTTVLLNLAVTVARHEGRRVAVVEANLRRPALSARLGIQAAPGLREVLAGSLPLARTLQETGQVNLRAIAAGSAAGDVRLPLDWLLPTLQQLREQFDLIFVDAPSWNEGSEVSALAATADAVYVVLHQKDAGLDEKLGALPGLRQPPSNLQGCILTMR